MAGAPLDLTAVAEAVYHERLLPVYAPGSPSPSRRVRFEKGKHCVVLPPPLAEFLDSDVLERWLGLAPGREVVMRMCC